MSLERISYRVRFAGGSGFELAGIIDRPQSESGEDLVGVPVVVFSHCFTCNKDLKAIARISRRLSTLGVAVLRYDMTGLGGSEGDFSQTNYSTNLRDLHCAVGFAEENLGPVTGLIGHSFGGAASLGWVAGLGDPSPTADPRRRGIRAVITLAAPSDTIHLAKLLSTMNPEIDSTGSGEVEIGGRRWVITRQMLDDFRSHRLADALPHVRCPVTIFHSPVDATVGFDQAIRMMGLIHDADGLPACNLVTLPGADHLLVNDPRDADHVADLSAVILQRSL